MSIEIGCAISSDVVDQPFEFDKLGVHSSGVFDSYYWFFVQTIGLSKLFFKFDKLAHLATLAIASDATFAGGKRLDDGLRNPARTARHRRIPRTSGDRFGGHVEITHGRANVAAQKQMEAALVSFNDSAFVNRADGLSKLFFKFDKLGVMGSTAQLRLRFLLLLFLSRPLVCQNCFSSLTNSV
jgi:hypothetical protein